VALKARKTEHSGAKKGRGAYWGRKAEAKLASKRQRREDGRRAIDEQRHVRETIPFPMLYKIYP
jgi:hypothetical protein